MRCIGGGLLVAGVLTACTASGSEDVSARSGPVQEGIDAAALEHLLSRAREEESSALAISVDGLPVARLGDNEVMAAMSISKSVASLAVGLLVDDGRLTLDAPVATWVPEWRGTPHEKILVRHLLNHTSGLDPKRADIATGDIAAHGATSPLLFEPGTRFQYNNNAVDLLAVVVGRAAGQALDALLQERLFDPLGIEDASWVKDRDGVPFAAGELRIRPLDLLAIGQLLADGGNKEGRRLISAEWIAQTMAASQEHTPSYGLLWWREGDFRFALTPALLNRWQEAGVPGEILAAIRPLEGHTFEDYAQVQTALVESLGDAGFEAWTQWLRSAPGVSWADQIQVGPAYGVSARGWLGQFLVILPTSRTVAVRLRPVTRDDVGDGPERNAYPSFPADVLALTRHRGELAPGQESGAGAGLERQPVRIEPPEIVATATWGSTPDPIPAERAHVPVRITIHHAGVTWKEGDDPTTKISGLQAWGRRDKGWPDVPYHFLIAPDGRIFAGRSLEYAGETNTEYDTTGHALVQLWGNFEEQRVSPAQLQAAVHLVAWLCQEKGISPQKIAGHRDWSRQTSCPGRDLHRYLADGSFRAWVAATLRGEAPQILPGPPLPEGPTAPILP